MMCTNLSQDKHHGSHNSSYNIIEIEEYTDLDILDHILKNVLQFSKNKYNNVNQWMDYYFYSSIEDLLSTYLKQPTKVIEDKMYVPKETKEVQKLARAICHSLKLVIL